MLRYVSGTSCKTAKIYGVKFYSMDLVNDMKCDQCNMSGFGHSKLRSYCLPFVDHSLPHTRERLQCFPFHDILVIPEISWSFQRYLGTDQVVKLFKIESKFWCFWAVKSLGRGPKFLTQFYKFRSPLNIVKIWWRSTQWPWGLGAEKKKSASTANQNGLHSAWLTSFIVAPNHV